MRIVKAIIGSLLVLGGVGLALLGGLIVWQLRSWPSIGGFVVLFGLGLAIAYVGYELVRGESVKDALYFLSFFH
ncbi:hypothetical protein GA0115259_101501 [Streptomyces sp. MnatMP-M17]|nr:hypothetical protein GA0115259_101501 [Streptomyces sp. MnatMP-M17]